MDKLIFRTGPVVITAATQDFSICDGDAAVPHHDLRLGCLKGGLGYKLLILLAKHFWFLILGGGAKKYFSFILNFLFYFENKIRIYLLCFVLLCFVLLCFVLLCFLDLPPLFSCGEA